MSVSLYGSGNTVVQVQSTTITSIFSTNSTSFVDVTGLSVSITPQSTNSKILVFVSGSIGSSTTGSIALFNLVRSGSNIYIGDARGSTTRCSSSCSGPNTDKAATLFISYLDSPATTSSVTYKLQMSSESTSYSSFVGGVNNTGSAYDASTPSTITVMEIAYS